MMRNNQTKINYKAIKTEFQCRYFQLFDVYYKIWEPSYKKELTNFCFFLTTQSRVETKREFWLKGGRVSKGRFLHWKDPWTWILRYFFALLIIFYWLRLGPHLLNELEEITVKPVRWYLQLSSNVCPLNYLSLDLQ